MRDSGEDYSAHKKMHGRIYLSDSMVYVHVRVRRGESFMGQQTEGRARDEGRRPRRTCDATSSPDIAPPSWTLRNSCHHTVYDHPYLASRHGVDV